MVGKKIVLGEISHLTGVVRSSCCGIAFTGLKILDFWVRFCEKILVLSFGHWWMGAWERSLDKENLQMDGDIVVDVAVKSFRAEGRF